jgi:catechol 2,3-dioxygenase-like lactoylglutathione lyase family enzyme
MSKATQRLRLCGVRERRCVVDWKIEVIVVPVSDVDRSKAFYSEQCGFHVDVDTAVGPDFRVVQLTPPGSACSLTIGPRNAAPGSVKGVQFVVSDIEAARAELVGRGVDATPVRYMDNGEWKDGKGGPWNSFFFFDDPDGNSFAVQEKPE